jgi:hypothetical protein
MPVLWSFRRAPWKRRAILVWPAVLVWIGVAVPANASVSPGTSVTASSAELVLNIEVDGLANTVKCVQIDDTFVVTSKDYSRVTIPPPTIDHCTDAVAPDRGYGSVNINTNDTNGNWRLEAEPFGSGGCHEHCVLGLVIPKKGATVSSAVLSGCEGVLAPSGPVLLTAKYDPSAGTMALKSSLVAIRGSGCKFQSPASLSVTITFSPNLGPVPPFAS